MGLRGYKYFAPNGACFQSFFLRLTRVIDRISTFTIRTVTLAMKFLARFEANRFSGRNSDLLARTRIAADTALARLDYENSKAAQLDSIAARQRVLHRVEKGFNCLLGLQLRDPSFVGKAI